MKKPNSGLLLTITTLFLGFHLSAQDNPFNKLEPPVEKDKGMCIRMSRIDSLTALYYEKNKIISYPASNFPVSPALTAEGEPVITPAEDLSFQYTFALSDAEYQRRLDQLESAIPLQYNNYVRQFIDLYGVRKRDLSSRMLTHANYYFPIFEEILDKNNLPLEFKYLSIVESALNPNAVSHCGATGLWQFMYSTGKLYDLRINPTLDERKDLYKSTQAACDYFKQMYNIYGDWLLVIASYNCGPGNVNKAIRRSGGKTTFWQIMPYLPRETRGYVPAFIAVAYMMNNAEKHFIYPSTEVEMKPLLAHVNVCNDLSFNQVATALDLSFDVIKTHNPTFKKGMITANCQQPLYLPYEYALKFISLGDSVYRVAPLNTVAFGDLPAADKTVVAKNTGNKAKSPYNGNPKYIRHTVKKGQGLNAIAQKYNCSPQDIKRWNKLKSTKLRAGQRLLIVREEPVKVVQKPTPSTIILKTDERNAEAKRDSVLHTVKAGETLYSISKKYQGVTVEKLKSLNNMGKSNNLKPGQVLIINN